ncbi:MAG: acetate--CoA ligase family protein [Synergistaceae bacterium]|nr:acetate--CoA ligase family protein [Synergistaceae bacterium]
MIVPIWNPVRGKLRVAGLASGSGNTLWKTLELQKELDASWEGSPFEVVALFSDSPEAKCVETANALGVPRESSDIRAFYAQRGAPLKDRVVRAEYDRLILEKLTPFRPDMILLAGYVWATTEVITKSLLVAGVHPADLSIMKDGRRAYAGADGVGGALDGGEKEIRASSYLATPEIDGGPILIISPGVPIGADEGMERKERIRQYLGLVNEQGGFVGARTVLEMAQGHFGLDEEGRLFYQNVLVPKGFKFESWKEHRPLHECSAESLLAPKSVAVAGASTRPGLGNAVLKNVLDYGYKGKLWAVNRGGEDVYGVKGYASVPELPETPDMVLVAVPGEAALHIVRQCGEKGVKAAVVLSAGFREVSGEGVERERLLMETVRRRNMRLLGPNCMGFVNTDATVSLNADMLQVVPEKGGVGFITQSGAIGSALIDFSGKLGIGFSMVVSTGNQPDMTVNDVLPLMAADKNTSVVLAYLETLPDPGRFVRVVGKASAKKPVIIVKSGRTAAGAQAASSHTGSLAGDAAITETLIEKTGAIRAKTLEEAFLLADALSKMPRFWGRRVGVISNAGGPGTLIADSLSDAGFELPLLPQAAREELAQTLLPQASTGNPLDLVATALPEHYSLATKKMAESGLYDALILMVVPPVGVDTGAVAEAVADSRGLPILSCFFGPSAGEGGRRVMLKREIPCFDYPEQMVQVLTLMRMEDLGSDNSPLATEGPALGRMAEIRELASGSGYLSTGTCRSLLSAYALPAARSGLARSGEDCGQFVEFSYPVVAKIEHPGIVHKSDVGGVILNLKNVAELRETVDALMKKFTGAHGVLVQEQVGSGLELILGANSDPALGHVLLVGAGGTGVEIHKDVTMAHVPLGRKRAETMLKSLRCWPLLKGYRGKEGVDVPELMNIMGKLERMLLDLPRIKELDLNPVIWDGKRFVIADCRIRV